MSPLKDPDTSPNPNYKFRKIAENARELALLGAEVSAFFSEAVFDGITAYRENRIKLLTKQIEAGARRLRQEVQIYKPEIVSQCEHCGHTVWRDD